MKTISFIGALWTNNFGDVLLAKLFKQSFEKNGDVILKYINLSEEVSSELGVHNSSFLDFFKTDKIVFIGGGYLSEPPNKQTKWILSRFKLIFMYAFFAKILHKPYYIIGVGAGPINNRLSKYILKKFCNGAENIIVRDGYSYETLKKLRVTTNIEISFDYALKLKETYKSSADKNTKKIVLHLTSKQQLLNEYIIKFFIYNVNNKEVWFIEDHPGEYERVKKVNPNIENLIGSNYILYTNNETMISNIDMFQFILTSKLHVGIVSSVLNKSICSFPYHDKVKQFYYEIGRDKLCFSKNILNEKDINAHINNCLNGENTIIDYDIFLKLDTIDKAIKRLTLDD